MSAPCKYIHVSFVCFLIWQGTLRDLSKGGRNLSAEQSDPLQDTPIDVKPTVLERILPVIQNEQGISEDPSKAIAAEGSNNHAENPSDEELPVSAEHLTNMGIDHSSENDDEQEPLVELSNPSDTDVDIPGKFD